MICKHTGKWAFASPNVAVCRLGRVQRRHHGRGALGVYRCRACGLWHHGRQRELKNKARG